MRVQPGCDECGESSGERAQTQLHAADEVGMIVLGHQPAAQPARRDQLGAPRLTQFRMRWLRINYDFQ